MKKGIPIEELKKLTIGQIRKLSEAICLIDDVITDQEERLSESAKNNPDAQTIIDSL